MSPARANAWNPTTPEDAALAPILDPAFLTGILDTVDMTTALSTSKVHAVGTISGTLNNHRADGTDWSASMQYTIDPQAATPVREFGVTYGGIGRQFMHNSLTTNSQGIDHLSGDSEDLTLEPNFGRSDLTGKIGSVDVGLRIDRPTYNGNQTTVKVHGTLGGKPYETTTVLTHLPDKDGHQVETLSQRGQVGGATIAKDYQIDIKQDGLNTEVNVYGTGTTAGTKQDIDFGVTLASGDVR
jgi:hypothetical protein